MPESSSKTAAEVVVRLVVDSNAKAAADEVAGELKAAGDAGEKAKRKIDLGLKSNLKSLGGLASAGLGMTAAAALAAGAAVVGFGVESAHAYMESASQIKTLANTFTLLDDGSTSLQNIKRFAAQTKDELEDLGIQAGISDDQLVVAFNDIMERGGKTVDQARELTEQMAFASRATAGGVTELSGAFEQIQMGIIRAKNPIVGMIAATHMLKGNAKDVARQMQKMTVEEQMALAEKAIGKMSEKMKEAPMSLNQMKTSMKVAFENIFEQSGEHIIKHMSPAVAKIRERFLQLQPTMVDLADAFGREAGKVFDILIPVVDELYKAITAQGSDLKATLNEVVAPFKEVFEYIYENKQAFAKTIADVAVVLLKAGMEIIKAMQWVWKALAAAGKFVGKSGVLGSDVAQGIGRQELDAQAKAVRKDVMGTYNTGQYGGSNFASREAAKDKFLATYQDTYGADKTAEGLAEFDRLWKRATDDHQQVMDEVNKRKQAALFGDTDSFVKAWNAAQKMQDEGAMNYVAQFLYSNKALQKALSEDGPKIMGAGFDQLVQTLKGQGTIGADTAKAITTMAAPKGIASKANVVQNFNGPINVKQDFRDQDPDRVALVFKEELGRVGTNRLQSRMVSPFGF